jgi:hypothetical protein
MFNHAILMLLFAYPWRRLTRSYTWISSTLHKFDGRNATTALHFTGADLLFQLNRSMVFIILLFRIS